MGVTLIRQNSDTPNVSNTDDARMIRFAYGGRNGVVKGYGQECAYSVNGKTFSIGSGCIVLQGWEVRLDANGWEITVGVSNVSRSFCVYLEINLATQTAEIKTAYNTGTANYPSLMAGDNLTRNTTGTARIHLYHFSAGADGTIIDGSATAISNVKKLFSVLDYDPTLALQVEVNELSARVDALGFKSGVATVVNSEKWTANSVTGIVVNTLQKQGKYCLFNIELYSANYVSTNADIQLSIPDGFKPKNYTSGIADVMYFGYVGVYPNQEAKYVSVAVSFSITTDGTVLIPVSGVTDIADLRIVGAETAFIRNSGWEIQ